MKANELMIGDWVQNPLGWKARVMSIKHTCVFKDEWEYLFKIGISKDNFLNNLSESELSPIPLTPDILEKNGMHLYNRKTNSLMEECNHSDIFEEDDDYRVELSLDYDGIIRWTINGDEYTIMPLDYVHQLQHALRLCGISKEIEL